MIKKITYYLAATSILIGVGADITLASTNNLALSQDLKEAATKIEQSHENLAIIKDQTSLSPEEKGEKEFSARQNVIKTAIELSLEEVKSLKERLNKIKELESESREEKIRLSYLDELSVYEKYYQTRSIELKGIQSIEALKEFAKSIIEYRDNVYNPSVQKIAEFLLLFYAEEAINIAQTRLEKMSSDINKLESLNIIKPGAFKSETIKASEFIKSAMDKYQSAKKLILESEIVIKKSSESMINKEISTVETEKDIKEKPLNAKEFMGNSLNDIKGAYEQFLKISKDVRKTLGLK